MGSSSKKYKEKDSRKRRHRSSRSPSLEDQPPPAKERRHHKHKKHHHHHKEKRREKVAKYADDSDGSSDVIEVVSDSSDRGRERESEPSAKRQGSSDNEESSKNGGGTVESLSIEETNKLRAKLGLKPLDVGGSSKSKEPEAGSSKKVDDGKKKDDWGEFYHKPAENLAQKTQQEKIKEKLTEIKEKRLLQNKLAKVKLLGESDSEDDTESWVDRNRRLELEKKEAEKRAKMLEELDEQFGVGEIVESEKREKRQKMYTGRDLKGLKVDHDIDSFAEERDVILTLKDRGVLDEDDEGDVLVNVNMMDNEKYKKNVENKKKKILYNAYEDNEFDEFGNPKEKSLLSKYDEEIEGEKRNSFKIGYDSGVERKQMAALSIKEKLQKKKLESIVEKPLMLASEFYNEEEMTKFKKPKKKIRKIRSKGKLTADDLLAASSSAPTGIEKIGSRRPKIKNEDMEIDDVPPIEISTDIKLEDDKDDILEKALHKTRKIRQKENIITEILKSTDIKAENPDEEYENNAAITLNATAEFCRTLGDIPTYGKSGNREENEELIDFEKDMKSDDSDTDSVKFVADKEDEEKSGWNAVDPRQNQRKLHNSQNGNEEPQDVQILDEEPDVSTGVGAALKLAMSKGYLDKEQNNRPSNSRLAHLQAQHYSIEDKTYGDDGTDRGSRRERYSGPVMEFREKEGFKPNVKLEYIDDEGHVLNSKEAFRYLSHKFHGKGPGKNKIEKRIQKSVQEQLMKKMSSTDTPLGTLNMLQAKQKETQSPFVVLSGSKQSQSTVISKAKR